MAKSHFSFSVPWLLRAGLERRLGCFYYLFIIIILSFLSYLDVGVPGILCSHTSWEIKFDRERLHHSAAERFDPDKNHLIRGGSQDLILIKPFN